jgi:transcriptional regulator with XRE-family HTH domain
MNWLKSLRIAKGFRTQKDLANASGVARPTIAKIEAGTIGLTVASGVGIARALGTSVEELEKQQLRRVRPYTTAPSAPRQPIDAIVAQAVAIDARVLAARAALLAAQQELRAAQDSAEKRVRAALSRALNTEPTE